MPSFQKICLIGAGVTVIIAIVASYVYWLMMGPMYFPGHLGTHTTPIETATKKSDSIWEVDHSKGEIYHFHEGKDGGENILVIHGMGASSKPWPGLTTFLNQSKGKKPGYQFHYYHQRGVGRSAHPIQSFDKAKGFYGNLVHLETELGIGQQLRDIESIRRLLQGDQPIILIGHSFGGFLAALYATEFPDKIKDLILVCPAPLIELPNSGEKEDLFTMIKTRLTKDKPKLAEEYEKFLKDYFKFDFDNTDERQMEMNMKFGEYYMQAVPEIFSETEKDEFIGGGWQLQALFASMGMHHDYASAMMNPKASFRTLVIHGGQDLQTKEQSAEFLTVFRNPDSRVVEIKDAFHFPMKETPDEFAKIIQNFLLKN